MRISRVVTTKCANPRCSKLFTQRRTNQKYCSDGCRHNGSRTSVRTIDLKFRAIDGEGVLGFCSECTCAGPKHDDECKTKTVTRYRNEEAFTFLIYECEHFTEDEHGHPVCECGHSIYDHEHVYVLFCIHDKLYENTEGFTWLEILEILYADFEKHPDAAYIGFFLDYDKGQWLKPPFPEQRAWKLMSSKGRKLRTARNGKGRLRTYPVDVPVHRRVRSQARFWQINTIPGKVMTIRPKTCKCDEDWCTHYYDDKMMTICDVGSFFQKRFVDVINPKEWKEVPIPWTLVDYLEIKEGKDRRSVGILDYEMRHYCLKECWLLEEVMKLINKELVHLKVFLDKTQWFGPGQIAQQLLSRFGAPKRIDVEATIPDEILKRLGDSYFGGWFEIFVHGHIPVAVYEYDIKSSYPNNMRKLPCLGRYEFYTNDEGKKKLRFVPHGKWHHKKRSIKTIPLDELPPLQGIGRKTHQKPLRLVHAHLKGNNQYIGAALHREWGRNTILCPHETSGWYWTFELDQRIEAKFIHTVEVDEWIDFIPTCSCEPTLRDFADLYEERKNAKSGVKRTVLKLGVNSPYGKIAQSIGDPMFSNPFWASLITAMTRTDIAYAISTHPVGAKAVCKVATDAVYFMRDEHNSLPISEELGEWECINHEKLTITKPGFDYDEKAREQIRNHQDVEFKRRGVGREFAKYLFELDVQWSQWNPDKPWPEIRFPRTFPLISPSECLQHHCPVILGSLNDDEYYCEQWHRTGQTKASSENQDKQGSDPSHKRTKPYRDEEYQIWRTMPYDMPQYKIRAKVRNGMSQEIADKILKMSLMLQWDCESFPYQKSFGIAAEEDNDVFSIQGVNPDGPQVMEWKSYLGIK